MKAALDCTISRCGPSGDSAITELPMTQDALNTARTRRALTHGGGIDGIFFMLLAAVGIGLVVVLLVVGLRTSETQATRIKAETHTTGSDKPSDLGSN